MKSKSQDLKGQPNVRNEKKSYTILGGLWNVFTSDMPQCLKREVLDQCVLPVMTHGAETLILTTASANKLMVTQRKMERSMLGVSLRDLIRNKDL